MKKRYLLVFLIIFFWLSSLIISGFLAKAVFPLSTTCLFGQVWWQRLANFDGFHYWNLVKDGYVYGLYQSFFPGFPLLMKPFYWLIKSKEIIIVGSVLNLTLFIFSLLLLSFTDYSKKNYSWLVALIVFWPASFYFISFYTESLFFLLSILAFYFYQKKRKWLSVLLAGLASGVRVIGIFIVAAFISQELFKFFWKKGNIGDKKAFLGNLLGFLLIGGIGLWLYMLFLKVQFNDPLMFVHNQSKFLAGRETGHLILLPQVIFRYYKMFTTTSFHNPIFFVLVLEVWSLFWGIVGLVYLSLRKYPLSLIIFGWASLLLPTLTGTLLSFPRYLLVIWPAFIGLTFLPKKVRAGLLVINYIFLIIAWMRFFQGWWVA